MSLLSALQASCLDSAWSEVSTACRCRSADRLYLQGDCLCLRPHVRGARGTSGVLSLVATGRPLNLPASQPPPWPPLRSSTPNGKRYVGQRFGRSKIAQNACSNTALFWCSAPPRARSSAGSTLLFGPTALASQSLPCGSRREPCSCSPRQPRPPRLMW